MALITWSENLSVNIREIDSQHKELVKLINEMHDAMSEGKGKDVLEKVLTRLIDYTKMHFSGEERLMETHRYAGYVTHKAEHEKLTKQVMEISNRMKEGKTVITIEVMNFLKEWLSKHIVGTDKKYGPFLNERGVV